MPVDRLMPAKTVVINIASKARCATLLNISRLIEWVEKKKKKRKAKKKLKFNFFF
jgi:hypothetical protein